MKNVHIVIPDLFLPQQLAAYASGDLRLPALEKMLARAQMLPEQTDTLEGWLCERFGVDALAIAPLTLQAEGVQHEGAYWMRADPVGIAMQRDEMVLQADVVLTGEEARLLCESLNAHFAEEGLRFVAPHPQRWYLRLDRVPAIETHPLPQVVGADMHAHLPWGEDALRWHSVLNEIQMLFYEHAVNQAREQRGEAVVSGVWFWGGGKNSAALKQPYGCVAGDSELARAFAHAANIPLVVDAAQMLGMAQNSDALLVWESLRTALQRANIGLWRTALQQFEAEYAAPLLAALASGEVGQITLDVLNEGEARRFVLTRPALWKFWRRPKPLLYYSPKQDTP